MAAAVGGTDKKRRRDGTGSDLALAPLLRNLLSGFDADR